MTILAKHSFLDVWQSSAFVSIFLGLLSYGSKRNARLIYAKLIIVFTQTKNFPLFWSHTWKYNIQVNGSLIKVKGKWSTVKFDVLFLSFIFLFPTRQKWPSFYTHQTVGACAGGYACDHTHQRKKSVFFSFF